MRRLWRLALLLALALMGGIGAAQAETVIERLVSPGALSRGHARLETRCTACHLSFKRAAQPAQCLTCHKGIARDRASGTRFHGTTPRARTAACRECHAEHNGLGHRLAPPLDLKAFNHQTQSAYRLTGAHLRTKCAACHGGMTHFRQTPQACAACHTRQDVHKGRLGPQCQSCHTTNRWRELLPFDHDSTRYPLTGAHRTTPCLGCHVKEQWHGTPTACVACHLKQDVHRGADGPRCADCHLTTNWRGIAFNHERVAAFPLRGAHRTVTCTGCHARTARPSAAPVPCVGCHLKDDVHRGADGPKCAECHSQSTWKVAKFDHANTGFALKGLHARVTCVGCHPKSVNTVKVGNRCIDCHKKDDVHNGTFGTICQQCHNPGGFRIPTVPKMNTPWRSKFLRDFPRTGVRD